MDNNYGKLTISTDSYWEDEYEKKINLDEAKFIFQQAEITLKDTIETSQLIVARTTMIAGISISVMVAIVSYIFTRWNDQNLNFYTLLIARIAAAYFFILNIIIVKNIHPSKYIIPGSNPSKLFTKHFFGSEYDNTEELPNNRLLEFYKVTIAGYEKAINQNKMLNKQRWRSFKLSLWSLTLSPVIILAFYFLIVIFR